jgi:PAP2 superfamily
VKTITEPAPARPGERTLADGRRLYWWRELLAVVVLYGVYSAIRNASEGSARLAFFHARQVMRWQRLVGINIEATLQHWALHCKPLVVLLNYVYGSLHFVVTGAVIIYLFRRHPEHYPRWRNALAVTTALALIGFVFWPLMPPRLLPARYGFVDTLARYPTLWSFDSGALHGISNQYAAMPSLHFAWSLFCACAFGPRAGSRRWRLAAWTYPALTLAAVVLTGNHFLLDAAGGAAAFGVACLLTRPRGGAESPGL